MSSDRNIWRAGRVAAAFFVLASLLAPRTGAQDEQALPPGKEIVEKFIQATGGRQAHDKIRSRVTHAKVELIGRNVTGTHRSYLEGPDKAYSVTDLGPATREERGRNGDVVWERTPQGVVVLEGEMKAFWTRMLSIDSDLNLDRHFKSVETRSIQDVAGRRAYQVEFTPHVGAPETRYYDVETGMLLGSELLVPTRANPVPYVTVPSDWRDVDGVKLPFRSQEIVPEQLNILVVTEKVEQNIDVPEKTFEVPAVSSPPATQPQH